MPAALFNFQIEQGADWPQEIAYIDENDDPVDLTGAVLHMQIRQSLSANTTLANLTIGSGITVTNATLGQFKLSLTNAQTSNLPIGSAVYDLEILYPDNTKERLLQGGITIDGEVTR